MTSQMATRSVLNDKLRASRSVKGGVHVGS